MQKDVEYNEWVSVPTGRLSNVTQALNKPRSMSEGGENATLQSIRQQTRTQRAYSMQTPAEIQPQKNEEQICRAYSAQIKTLSEQLGMEGVNEQSRKALKKELLRLKLEISAYEERTVQGFLRGSIMETSRNRLVAEGASLRAQREMLEIEYRLATEQFDPYVQSILSAHHVVKREEIERGEELIETTRTRGGSEDFLMAENKVLRAQNEVLTIEGSLVGKQFNTYVKALLRTHCEKKTAEVKYLDIQAKELEIIEIDEVLENDRLSNTERSRLEVKSLTLKWHLKKYELSKLEKAMESMTLSQSGAVSLSQSGAECLPLEADILSKQIRMIEIEGGFKTQTVPSGNEESWTLELEQLIKDVEFLGKRKKYVEIRWQLKNVEFTKSEQIRLETTFAFLQVELLMSQKSGEESTDLKNILDHHKRAYERMQTIEGHFREDQKMRVSTASSTNSARNRV